MPRMSVKSGLATCRHLIRHVELRTRLEAAMLLDDIDQTRQLLAHLAGYLAAVPDAGPLVAAVRASLSLAKATPTGAADDLERIRAQALALREHVYAGLKCLQGLNAELQASAPYQEVRRLIRAYIAYEIQQEARLIDPAFVGQGPRR